MSIASLRAYYKLTKPGVLYGNVLTGVAGYLLAAHGNIDWLSFVSAISGMTLVIAGACALNNYLDQDIDSQMERTKKRPSVTGEISGKNMVAFASLLTLLGFLILVSRTNWLVVLVGVVGFVTYVWLYGALTKRRSVHGTIVGSISGAMPVLGGYVAASGRFDVGALVVFLILFFWQFPEFYSISIYRKKEYSAAHIPVISVARGVGEATWAIFVYTVLYVLATISLTLLGYTGWVYFWIMLMTGLYWIYIGYQGFGTKNIEAWSRRMFRFSMLAILVLCLMLSIGPLLP